MGIGVPVLAAVIADIVSAVIKHKQRMISSSSPRRKFARLKSREFLPPLIGLAVCLTLAVIFRLFLRLDRDIGAHVTELI